MWLSQVVGGLELKSMQSYQSVKCVRAVSIGLELKSMQSYQSVKCARAVSIGFTTTCKLFQC